MLLAAQPAIEGSNPPFPIAQRRPGEAAT
jgi:hypothetical protein